MAVFRAFCVIDPSAHEGSRHSLERRTATSFKTAKHAYVEFTYSADYLAGAKTPYVQPVLRFRRTRFTSRSHPYLILTKLSKPVFMRLAEIHTLWSQKLLATLKTAALETITDARTEMMLGGIR